MLICNSITNFQKILQNLLIFDQNIEDLNENSSLMISLKCFASEFFKYLTFCWTLDTSHILSFIEAQNVMFVS